jgi:HMG (high mobility group) box
VIPASPPSVSPLPIAAAKAAKDALKQAKKEKKSKKAKKLAGAPKKPMSAFFCYQQARRENLKSEAPNLDHKDIIKVSSNHSQCP